MSRSFNPADPGEIAAKDQIFSLLSENAECLNMLAGASKSRLREMTKSGAYLTEFQFVTQIVMTMLEERKEEEEEELCWPPGSESFPCSPGWKFLLGLIKSGHEEITPEEGSLQAARIFRRLVSECLPDLETRPDGKGADTEAELEQLVDLRGALVSEIDMMERRKLTATKDVLRGLKDWLWLMSNPELLATLESRLVEFADLGVDVELEPLHRMQLEIRKYRKDSEDA